MATYFDMPPLRVRTPGSVFSAIPVHELIVSGGTLTRIGAAGVQIMVDSGAGGTTYVLGTPVLVGSGGTGQLTLTAFGLLYGSGGSPVQVLAPMSAGSLVVGSGVTTSPFILGSGGAGQVLLSSGGVVGGLAWVTTLGGATGSVYAATGNQYLTLANAADLTAERVWTASTGMTSVDGGADSTFLVSVNPNIRDKTYGFFAAGTVSTTMLACSSAIYIPFNMQVVNAYVAMGVSASNDITLRLVQYNRLMTTSTTMVANANTIRVAGLLAMGSDTGTFNTGTIFAGSWLGFHVMSTGAATFGEHMTVSVVVRSS